jgi:AcrR family transcriptional regulator
LAGLIAEDTPGLIAGLHILLLSRRNPIVGEVVDEFIMTHVRRRRGDGTYTAANPSGLIVFSMVIVHLFINTFYKVDPVFMANGVSVIRHMIAARTAPPDLTQIPPLQPAFAVPLDSLRARLSDAAFHVVGKSGFQLATVSRIARKAGVAASSIYKIYDSKEELIADCYLQAYRFHWMRLINFVHVLEPGVLSTMMSTALRDSNKPRREFALEFAIASAHNETLKKAAVKQMADLEDIIPDLDLTEEIMLRQLIRFLTYALIGINMIEVLSGEASSWPDLVSFGESLRLGLLHGREETWAGLREKMLAYDRRVNSLTSISS